MNDKENIKNRFMDFEPEVDDLLINQNWEKIKYFVPQKEPKRRSGFFFLYGAAAFLVICGLVMLTFFSNIFYPTKIAGQPSRLQKKHIVLSELPSIHSQLKNKKVQHFKLSNNLSVQKNNISSNEPLLKQTTDKNFVALWPKTIPASDIHQNNATNDPVSYHRLDPFTTMLPTEKINIEIDPVINNDYFFPKPTSTFSYDLFVGVQRSSFSIKQNTTEKNSYNGFLIGASINHQLRNKFIFTGQFVFSKANLNYRQVLTQNKIMQKYIATSSTSSLPDTTRYMLANTNYSIRSQNSYHTALGLEYQVLQKGKFTINAALLFDICFTKYKYGYTRRFSKDVLVHVKGEPNNPNENVVSSTFYEGDFIQSKDMWSSGLMPSTVISYRLSAKYSVIFKPSYLIDLTEKDFIMNSSAFKLKQNSFLLNAGLRFNF
jgi:hypothetical protein